MEGKWYMYTYDGGEFPVAFRPYGVFHCPSFPAVSSYTAGVDASGTALNLLVKFGKYGDFTFASTDSSLGQFNGIDLITKLNL
jgi:hypothetical protein